MGKENTIFASDLAFKTSISNTGDLSMVINKAAINQSIYSIIKTKQGTRIGNPLFGAGIESFLFEPLTQDTAENIGKAITNQIKLWEPRIQVLNTEMLIFDSPQAGYKISINYFINQTFTNGEFETFLPKLN